MKETLEPTLENLSLYRQDGGQRYTFDRPALKNALINNPDFKKEFYNRSIEMFIHTDGPVGHVSGHFPCLQPNGSIKVERFIGLNPKNDNDSLYKLIFGTGSVFSSHARSMDPKQLQSAIIPLSQEMYYKLASEVALRKESPGVNYNGLGFGGGNCIFYANQLLCDVGIVDGLSNKFNRSDFDKTDWRLIKIQAERFFDRRSVIGHSEIEGIPIPGSDEIRCQYYDRVIRNIQLDKDIDVFLNFPLPALKSTDPAMPVSTTSRSCSMEDFFGPDVKRAYSESYGLTYIGQHETQALFQINRGSPLLLNNTQSSLDLNHADIEMQMANIIGMTLHDDEGLIQTISMSNINHGMSSHYKSKDDKPPFITDIRLGAIAGGVGYGIIATLNTGGTVAVGATADGGGWLVSVGAATGKGFLSAMIPALGIGIGIAVVAITVQLFFKHQHKKMMRHLKKDLQNTRNDLNSVNAVITELQQNLQQINKDNIATLLEKTNKTIQLVTEKIKTINSRIHYASKHKQKDLAKEYKNANQNLNQQRADLAKLQQELECEKIYVDFIKQHQNADVNQLIGLATEATNKNKFTQKDVAIINGVRQLILQKTATLMAQGNLKDTLLLLEKTATLRYFLPGNFSIFTSSKIEVRVKNNDHAFRRVMRLLPLFEALRKKIEELNGIVSEGKNPANQLKEVDKDIQSVHDLLSKLITAKGVKGNLKEIFAQFNIWKEAFDKQKSIYKDGTPIETLKLNTLHNLSIEYNKQHDRPIQFWLDTLAKNTPKESNAEQLTEENLIAQGFSSYKIIGYIWNKSAEGNFDEALDVAIKFKTLSKDHETLADAYITQIKHFKENKDAKAEFWLNEISRFKKNASSDNKDDTVLIQVVAPNFIIKCVFKEIYNCNFDEASNILNEWLIKDSEQQELITTIKTKIEFGKSHLAKDDTFWLDHFRSRLHQSEGGEGEEQDGIVNLGRSFEHAVAVAVLHQKSNQHSENGHFGKASIIMKELQLRELNPDFKKDLQKSIDLLDFHHHGQLLNAFMQPIEGIIAREVLAMKPSWKKTGAQFALNTINAAQIAVPNVLPLTAQGLHAKYYLRNTDIFSENVQSVKNNLLNTLKAPFNKFSDPGNGLKAPNKADVALLYSQLALLALNYGVSPLLERFIIEDKNLLAFDKARFNILNWGNRGIGAGFAYTAFTQLAEKGLSHAYAPFNVAALGKLGFNFCSWLGHTYYSRQGCDSENPRTYSKENIINSGLGGAATVLFVAGITGGFGLLAYGALTLSSGAFVHDWLCETSTKNNAAQALAAALGNIEYWRNKYPNDYDRYIEKSLTSLTNMSNILHSTFKGLAYNANDNEAANVARACLFYHSLRDLKIDALLEQTNTYETGEPPVVSSIYRMPAYMVWNIIVGLRLAKLCEHRILEFRENYQRYSDYIYKSAPDEWRRRYMNDVLEAFNDLVKYALQQYVVMAEKQNDDPVKKKQYLDQITLNYRHAKEWSELLSPELKFWAAYLYYQMGYKSEAKIFAAKLSRSQLKTILKNEQDLKITQAAVNMLDDVDQKLQEDILLDRVTLYVGDGSLQNTKIKSEIIQKIKNKKYEDVYELFDEIDHVDITNIQLARVVFESSGRLQPLKALEILDCQATRASGKNRTFEYWSLLYDIALEVEQNYLLMPMPQLCQSSFRSNTKQKMEATIFFIGLQKLCLDRLMSYKGVESSVQQKFITENTQIVNRLKSLGPENHKEMIEEGHKCLRGETQHCLTNLVKNRLSGVQLFYPEGDQHFFIVGVNGHSHNLFLCLGLTSKEIAAKLRACIKPVYTAFKIFYADTQNKNVIESLLTYIEGLDHKLYNRTHTEKNVDRIGQLLDDLANNSMGLPLCKNGSSILSALAHVEKKNFVVLISDKSNLLVPVFSTEIQPEYETIYLVVKQTSMARSEIFLEDHFFRLEEIHLTIEEDRSELLKNKKKILVSRRQITAGSGNCAFHAAFGELKHGIYTADKADEMRAAFYSFLSCFNSPLEMAAEMREKIYQVLQYFYDGTMEVDYEYKPSDDVKELIDQVKAQNKEDEKKITSLKKNFIENIYKHVLQYDEIGKSFVLKILYELLNSKQNVSYYDQVKKIKLELGLDPNLNETIEYATIFPMINEKQDIIKNIFEVLDNKSLINKVIDKELSEYYIELLPDEEKNAADELRHLSTEAFKKLKNDLFNNPDFYADYLRHIKRMGSKYFLWIEELYVVSQFSGATIHLWTQDPETNQEIYCDKYVPDQVNIPSNWDKDKYLPLFNGVREVHVCHNGINHYERFIRPHEDELVIAGRVSKGAAQKFSSHSKVSFLLSLPKQLQKINTNPQQSQASESTCMRSGV